MDQGIQNADFARFLYALNSGNNPLSHRIAQFSGQVSSINKQSVRKGGAK